MSKIGDMYLEWLQTQEEELLRALSRQDCICCTKENKQHPKLVPSLTAHIGKN